MTKKQSVEIEREEKTRSGHAPSGKLSKIRLWAYIFWIIGLFLIVAKYMNFFPD